MQSLRKLVNGLPRVSSRPCRGSPLGQRAVRVAPQGIAPALPHLRGLAHGRLVDLDAESRSGRPRDMAVAELEDARVEQVVQEIGPRVVVDAEAGLLDQRV